MSVFALAQISNGAGLEGDSPTSIMILYTSR
jgi:hypothetical protein